MNTFHYVVRIRKTTLMSMKNITTHSLGNSEYIKRVIFRQYTPKQELKNVLISCHSQSYYTLKQNYSQSFYFNARKCPFEDKN